MQKYQYVEVFRSIEGEALFSGWPTIYVRFTKCNFTCAGFNNPDNVNPADPAILKFDPRHIKSLSEIPEISVGCDSIYAHNEQFSHLWTTVDAHELAQSLTGLLPSGLGWDTFILSLTGGEPTLRLKALPELLNQPEFENLKTVLIETNCAVPLNKDALKELKKWVNDDTGRRIIWSNSPKLKVSGEMRKKAIIPSIAMDQWKVGNLFGQGVMQYFKFVCDASRESFEEVLEVMQQYWDAGVPKHQNIFIMPMACTESQQQEIAAAVADMCIEYGFIYSHRVHNSVYNNAIGK